MEKMTELTELTQDDFGYLYDYDVVEYETTFEIVRCIKLQKLVKEELREWEVEWKDFKPECGTAALDQHGANMVMSVLKSLIEGSKK